jgi:hypothetical protein
MNAQIFWTHLVWDYIRSVSYLLVILTDLRDIKHRRFTNLLYVGDTILASGLLFASLNWSFNNILDPSFAIDVFGTPVVIAWAALHVREFLKR